MERGLSLLRHMFTPQSIYEWLWVLGNKNKAATQNGEQILSASIDWLLRSFAATGKKGFSASYSLKRGWDAPYPETTGYLISTLLNVSRYTEYRKDEIIEACTKSGQWLLALQATDGSFPGLKTKTPYVFDTGQIIFGLIGLYKFTEQAEYLRALKKASDWLCSIQESDGSWIIHAFGNLPHTYYSRVAWALAETYLLTSDITYKNYAVKNLEWVLGQQKENGWFENSGFFADKKSGLHTIAYTVQGLLEGGRIFKEEKYILAAKKTADKLSELHDKKMLFDVYAADWAAAGTSMCLTGLAQTALVWRELSQLYPEGNYNRNSKSVVDFLKNHQNSSAKSENIRGAIAGSFPIWGSYLPFSYPNWAAKFFIDLLIQEDIGNKSKKDLFFRG